MSSYSVSWPPPEPGELLLALDELREDVLRLSPDEAGHRLGVLQCWARGRHVAVAGCTRADPDNPGRSISESWCSTCGWHSGPEGVAEHARRVLGG